MNARRRLNRSFIATRSAQASRRIDFLMPRTLRRTVIDFRSLQLPAPLTKALAEAFWSQHKARSLSTMYTYWYHLKIFARFARERRVRLSLTDISGALLIHYIEWLNKQRGKSGKPWSQQTRSCPYVSLCALLQWLQRCKPGLLGSIEYPHNPFPGRNRSARQVERVSTQTLRTILKACERDITQLRAERKEALERMNAVPQSTDTQSLDTLEHLRRHVDRHYDGLIPSTEELHRAGHCTFRHMLERAGGRKHVEAPLYPRPETLFPYYLAILIHTGGNPEPITRLRCECLQPIPLMEDRELVVWQKTRAGTVQRRSFPSADPFEPPALVREILEWTRRLRPHVARSDRDRLFLVKSTHGVRALSMSCVKPLPRAFAARHQLPAFTLAAIRPSVLTAFYRASGDLRTASTVANHAQLATTVSYVQGPEVEAHHRLRLAALQSAWVAHFDASVTAASAVSRPTSMSVSAHAAGQAMTVFGFDCKDPFAGVASGTRRGELCTHFLGCLTCPNAIIPSDAVTLARLLQARDHLRASAAQLHPARWAALYAPQLRILEEDILARFSAGEMARAAPLQASLPPLLPLR
ncbi:MAG TPA: hypothetical protein VI653_31315 [Steroidobacteraceae bacterium]